MAYHRTVLQMEVLSEEPFEWDSLADVNYAIIQGDCSGKVEEVERTTHTAEEMAALLRGQGSDPGFFGIEEDAP